MPSVISSIAKGASSLESSSSCSMTVLTTQFDFRSDLVVASIVIFSIVLPGALSFQPASAQKLVSKHFAVSLCLWDLPTAPASLPGRCYNTSLLYCYNLIS
ncbi:BA75_03213T0 [Komagataella pastoris]|uniref:BA75_03213T0 n=1 Tax=Komagataella pastoris TaxID=4922 RepID=A0A1B2JDW1_PICPA|nr:BA75_03213T0 [Komagataella pastoris]